MPFNDTAKRGGGGVAAPLDQILGGLRILPKRGALLLAIQKISCFSQSDVAWAAEVCLADAMSAGAICNA